MNQNLKDICEKQQNEIDKLKEQLNNKNETFDSQSIRNYKVIENIGNGNGNKVIKIALTFYVLKEINIKNVSSENLDNLINEYKRLDALDHLSILKIQGTFFHDDKIQPSILIEYCQMNLEQAIKSKAFSNPQRVFVIYQIAEGMKYAHFNKIIHRNLKPTNILILKDNIVKICDFGIAHLMSAKDQILSRGNDTQKFMAPELINDEKYNEKADVYSFGIIVYFILSNGELPIFDKKGKLVIPPIFQLLAQQLLEVCCDVKSGNRPSFETICDTLNENDFDLISLNQQEMQETVNMIKNYKSRIPIY